MLTFSVATRSDQAGRKATERLVETTQQRDGIPAGSVRRRPPVDAGGDRDARRSGWQTIANRETTASPNELRLLTSHSG